MSEDSEARQGTKWNERLFDEYLPETWIRNLNFLRDLNEKGACPFTGWGFWPAGSHGEGNGLGKWVLGNLFARVAGGTSKLLPTVYGTTKAPRDIMYTLELSPGMESAFRDAHVPVVCPPQDRKYELSRPEFAIAGLSPLTPDKVRSYLTKIKDSLASLPLNSRIILLKYILSDNDFRNIGLCKAPLIPVKDGSFESFDIAGRSGYPLIISRDDNEAQIFDQYPKMVDISKMPTETTTAMRRSIAKFDSSTRVQMWQPDDAAWYYLEYIFEQESNDSTIIR